MEPKVRWQRESENGTAVPYMFEKHGDSPWRWYRYNRSRMYKGDKDYLSKGYASFIAAKNAGYIIELKVENQNEN